ncbi:iron-siderophore ABC transporter substrate-binding protein [Streptomyces sp. NPDC002055]|uniref:iron-siderophore ABC transporter substrate-binding protein n=1 Tax=Streptomyces sp. NPDC002055 TaxID=3154534 RepID=UPI003321D564
MSRTRALTATAVLAALALTGCGTGRNAAPEGETRTVNTAMGKVRVPVAPKRVVVLDTAELDSAITLGVKPVGATNAGTRSGFLRYLSKDQVSGIRNVGTIGSPDLEAVNKLKPDLILSNKARDAKNYTSLKAIAPTVLTETTGYPWKENFRVHAAALGKKQAAAKAVAAYRAHTRKVTDALGGPDRAKRTEVNIVRFVEGADTRVYGEKSYIATVLKDVGLGRPAVVHRATDGFSYDVSPERIDDADADAVFYTTYGDPEKAKETRILRSGLWKRMTAVRNERSFRVDDETWIQGIGYTAADTILDELGQRLG